MLSCGNAALHDDDRCARTKGAARAGLYVGIGMIVSLATATLLLLAQVPMTQDDRNWRRMDAVSTAHCHWPANRAEPSGCL
ncbi:hypothetical protein OAN307_c27470 [Octadecabacter antarcticus 307]|uniref:Uncharacterized protein n=1 Tax=Octadecabacter antarcticus 307 TaxID=391626 RepID=M9R957_9RHOB|nr:hypothetical protein OAN307_c27470 [Octadecabacter antarcticus 307]